MKEIYNQIIENTKKIAANQDSFSLPQINNATVISQELETIAPILFKEKFIIENNDGKIEVTYESKDKCRVSQINPDWNRVEVLYLGTNGDRESYTDGWSDKI
ncbi:hypothetical protein [Chryseobacterium jejuense]|uniref:Uncharacterized protein n=1 Tax=Chryseobacterium jejuense TaxID=445960 RepID=A0A2X2VHM8_CHRJE|nr:hypothetical protein [Chryseobacterium jejuense]SDJ11147.1 hypothetical protein SAMN05421542_2680 [Chryseobacterium jejuense]SQB27914.1 Uncharacterised protein [Chryseobacterium jejuense]